MTRGAASRGTRSHRFNTVTVVGLGYVGLPTALIFARAGLTVWGCDIDDGRVEEVLSGSPTWIQEDDLLELCAQGDIRQRLSAATKPAPADAFILAVPTPIDKRRQQSDLSALIGATQSILPVLRQGNLVVVESTVPPLTCRQVVAPLIEGAGFRVVGPEPTVHLAHCPERVLPGSILRELVHNDRVIGGITANAAEVARDLYETFVSGQIYLTDDVTAELCKLIENSYRDVNIALANELGEVALNLGVEPREVISLANRHPRVHILAPGIGVGGHCIPVDPWFIKEVDPHNSRLISVARAVNDAMPARIAGRIRRRLADLKSPRIIAIGATYKPNTYDLRESPALEVVRLLREDGYYVELFDPLTREFRCESVAEVARDADCLVILVPHDVVLKELAERRSEILASMRQPILLIF